MLQVRSAQVRTGQVCAGQVCAAQVFAFQVCAVQVTCLGRCSSFHVNSIQFSLWRKISNKGFWPPLGLPNL